MSGMGIAAGGGLGSPYGNYGGYGDYGYGNEADYGLGGYGKGYGEEDANGGVKGYAEEEADGGYNGAESTDGEDEAVDTGECETCKNRKYQDGSDEMVSFKAAGHIDPDSAASVVMSHEQEHVSNAYQKADLEGGEVVRASVRLKTDICPECGRTFISGGVTSTQIRYVNETNPYQKELKSSDLSKYLGANVDIAAG